MTLGKTSVSVNPFNRMWMLLLLLAVLCGFPHLAEASQASDMLLDMVSSGMPVVPDSRQQEVNLGVLPCPSNSSQFGYPDFDSLLLDLNSNAALLFLCPGIVYQATAPLRIPANLSAIVACTDGASCVVEATVSDSLVIVDTQEGQSLTIIGITFRSSTASSIVLNGSPGVSIISFSQCRWEGNAGTALIQVNNNSTNPTSGRALQSSPEESFMSPTIVLLNCTFGTNPVTDSLFNVSGVNLLVVTAEIVGVQAPVVNLQVSSADAGAVVYFQNVGFQNMTSTAIRAELDVLAPTFLEFDDCEWEFNAGRAAIEIVSNVAAGRRRRRRRLEQVDVSSLFLTNVTGCSFHDNDYTESVILQPLGYLLVDQSEFDNNAVGSSVVGFGGVEGLIESTSFSRHQAVNFGLIFVATGSQVNVSNSCGDGNTEGTFACNGTLYEVGDPANCVVGDELACSPSCFELDSCDTVNLDTGLETNCYSTWANLSSAIASGTGGDYLLCAGVTLTLQESDSPIELGAYSTSIMCSEEQDCIIDGGLAHFRIPDGDAKILFKGLSFRGAERVSVEIEVDPTFPASIEFQSCQWQNNTGTAAINVVAPGATAPGRSLQDQVIVAELKISDCEFLYNSFSESVVQNFAVQLHMEDSVFLNNSALSIVRAAAGENVVDSAYFGYNEVGASIMFVGADVVRFNGTNVCGINNTLVGTDSCNGSFLQATDPQACRDGVVAGCQQACLLYPECPRIQPDCYATYGELASDLTYFKGSTFEICEGSVLEVSDSVAMIEDNGTRIRCGPRGQRDGNCIVSGGQDHFRIAANTSSVVVEGMTFQGAMSSSITVEVNALYPTEVIFSDCQWKNNSGIDTFSIFTAADVPPPEGPPTPAQADGLPQNSSVTVSACLFELNTAAGSILSSSGDIELLVQNSDFTQNTAGESVLEVGNGSSAVDNVGFSGNVVQRGVVFVGFGATFVNGIGGVTGACSQDDTVGANCSGLIQQLSASSACLDGVLAECELACDALPACTTACYSNWDTLVADVADAQDGKVFVVCAGQDFSLAESPTPMLTISSSNTVVRCGSATSDFGSCVLRGGQRQVTISGSVVGVRLVGLTFMGSSEVAIHGQGDMSSTASVENCVFMNHAGGSSILVSSEPARRLRSVSRIDNLQTRTLQVIDLPAQPSSPSMQMTVDSCLFKTNSLLFSPIAILRGDVSVLRSRFEDNVGQAGAIVGLFESSLVLTDSCFLRNMGNASGAIVLQEQSNLVNFSNNYGDSNLVMSGNCTDSLVIGEAQVCTGFDGLGCGAIVPLPPLVTPTMAPVGEGVCYSEWNSLVLAVNASQGDETFVICQNTTFDLTREGSSPLQIRTNLITIECESWVSGSCQISGGQRHMELHGDVVQAVVRRVTMMGASDSSVYVAARAPFYAEFDECVWKQNTGQATVVIENVNASQTTEPIVDDDFFGATDDLPRALQETDFRDEVLLVCDRCLFESNTAAAGILVAQGSTVGLDAVEFSSNVVQGSIVNASNSKVTMSSSCLSTNNFANELVGIDENSEVQLESNFGTGNSNSADCGGFVVGGSCSNFDSEVCLAERRRCFADWDTLAFGISTASAGSVLSICKGSVLDGTDKLPMSLSENIQIRCGVSGSLSGNCVVFGGDVQFEVTGSPTEVVFMGLTSTGAATASIHAAGTRSASLRVIDCLFSDIRGGQAAILVYEGTIPAMRRLESQNGRRRTAIADYVAPADRSMTVEVQYSTFERNVVALAPVANLGGSVSFVSCEFTDNVGVEGGAIAVAFNGGSTVVDSCFTTNTGSNAGVIYVSADSALPPEENRNNFGFGNVAQGGGCAGTFLAGGCESEGVCNGLCVEPDATSCSSNAAPSLEPTPAPTIPSAIVSPVPTLPNFACSSTWAELSSAVAGATQGIKNVFRVCPETVLDVGSSGPIEISSGEISIECGANGDLGDNCTISGGEIQFRLTGNPAPTFVGIQMVESVGVSVLATASSSTRATFEQCQWRSNQGSAAILIHNAGITFTSQTDIGSLTPPTSPSMTIDFDNCDFLDNRVLFASVVNFGGTSTFLRSTFIGNSRAQIGALFAGFGALLALSSSCFVDNESEVPGTILLSNGAQLSTNDLTYGTFNRVDTPGECTDIFTETSGSCVTDFTCEGACSVFEAETCDVIRADFVVPTASPTVSPSALPTAVDDTTPGRRRNATDIEFNETNLFSSNYWLRNIFVGLIVLVAGGGAYVYCKIKGGKGGGSNNKNNKGEGGQEGEGEEGKEEMEGMAAATTTATTSSETEGGGEDGERRAGRRFRKMLNRGGKKRRKKKGEAPEPYFADDDVILDPEVSIRRKKGNPKGFFGFGKKKTPEDEKKEAAASSDDDDDDDTDSYPIL